ncbi:GNAT family N-acetyltransferase [Candidatus Entotheonella palauensis]|uniref:GNAT family N-acetyltransferase n=1 Tax=Candidatus Entotheonella palauensis TaxID=93172 RepID=UPI000B80269F|nr:GNAT family N-acetyltransferase [Candidatus Entotheonella palauensis]
MHLNTAPAREMLATYYQSRVVDPYALTDLDDFFWPHTRWWTLEGDEPGVMAAVFLINGLHSMPILYAVAPQDDALTLNLLRLIEPELPAGLFGLLPPNTADVMPHYHFSDVSMMLRMQLERRPTDHSGIVSVGPAQQHIIEAFLATAYTEDEADIRLFESYMLERWPHVACIEDGEIVSFGGTHVLTHQYAAAGIGNIVTQPGKRGGGRASRVTEALCARLWRLGIRHIGLNVAESNTHARRCYDRLGFVEKLRFIECSLTR